LYFLFTSPGFRSGTRVAELTFTTGLLAALGLWLVYAPPAGLSVSGTSIYLNGHPVNPAVGSLLPSVGIPVYFASLLLRRTTYTESKGVRWIVTHLGGLGVISYLGDQFFIYDNFLQPSNGYPITLQPLGLLNMSYDMAVFVLFSGIMMAWGYYSALRQPSVTPTVAARASIGDVASPRA
jgi:hypothetical protein